MYKRVNFIKVIWGTHGGLQAFRAKLSSRSMIRPKVTMQNFTEYLRYCKK